MASERLPPEITGWLPHPAGDQGPLSITPGRDFWRYVFTAAALNGGLVGGPPDVAAARAAYFADAVLAKLEEGEDASD